MKKRVLASVLCASLMMAAAPSAVMAEDAEFENLMPGGDFEAENANWGLYTESGGTAETALEDGALHVKIEKAGSVDHAVQIFCDGFKLVKGGIYRVSFDMTSTAERTFEWRAQINGGDYHAYFGETLVPVGPEGIHYEMECTMDEYTDPAPRFCFNLGDKNKKQGLEAHEVIIDNVKLELIAGGEEADAAEETGPKLFVNQVGFKTGKPKLVSAIRVEPGSGFEVVYKDTGKVMFSGNFSDAISSESCSDDVVIGDFSKVTIGGTYVIELEDGSVTEPFEIGGAYDDLLADTLRMLYLQRCGIELTEEQAGAFAHGVCHDETAVIYGTDEEIEVSGGWHDAGDYGRYTVPGAKAAADLMLAYELNADAFSDEMGIPESGNGVADVLDEARYELEWLLKMQNEEGGVYHKVTGLNFDGTVKADECTEKLYVLPVSEAATGDFAAVMYMAGRTFKEIDPDFADTCLQAADKAFAYFEAHIDEPGFTNPSDVLTGEYPDTEIADEYYWAAAEGLKAGKYEMAQVLADMDMNGLESGNFGWQDVAGYGAYALLGVGDARGIEALQQTVMTGFLAKADELAGIIETDPYGSSIEKDYPWGSNMTIANNGLLLAMAAKLTENKDYMAAANRQLDYLLGVNPTGYCYVSGWGTLSPQHPHHRPSQAAGEAMPGMLAGGPNSSLEDPYAANVLAGKAPAECYADSDQSYSTNEIAIYWNSPLVALLAATK